MQRNRCDVREDTTRSFFKLGPRCPFTATHTHESGDETIYVCDEHARVVRENAPGIELEAVES